MFRNRKRISRIVIALCLSIILGLLPVASPEITLNVNAAAGNVLANGDFEADDIRPLNWNVNAPNLCVAIISADAPGNSTRVLSMKNMGTSYLEVDSDWFGIVPGGEYHFSLRSLRDYSIEATTSGYTAFVMWKDAAGNLDAKAIGVKPTNTWQEFSMDVTIPENAVTAAIRLYISAGKHLGTYVDDVSLVKTGGADGPVTQPTQPTVPTSPTTNPANDPTIPVYREPTVPKDYDAPEITQFPDSHPYMYFDEAELAELKEITEDSSKNLYGFSWKTQKEYLLYIAQSYLIETTVRQNSNYGTHVIFEVYPELKDPNDPSYRPMYIAASKNANGNLVENPYLGFGSGLPATISSRIKVLSLAYVLTGDTRYSDLAIRYAVEMSQWKWWGDWNWLYTYTKGSMVSDASAAWAMEGVATAYDLCYDQLTPEQRKIIETAIIEKGLKPLSNQVNPQSTANANMMYIGGMLTGCAAIITEENYAELKPYVDLALYCVEVAYDNYAFSGNTEGHYYTSFGLEYFLPGVSCMYGATKLDFLFDHPLMSEMLPYWTVQFAASGSMTHPNYSDASVSTYMKLPMAIISKNVGNGLAGYFMNKTGGLGSPWLNLVYLDPTPVVENPTDYVAVVDPIGYGSLRTGFAADDMMLTLLANDSQMSHNHWDQNSIQLAIGSNWLLKDPGVGSYYYKDRTFWQKSGHSTILVNGNSQTVRGTGTLRKVFGNQNYGYIIGTAPHAYGNDVLTKFNRHAIQINHTEKAYYVLIDDLASPSNKTYGWQMYNGDRDGFTVDGTQISDGGTLNGNQVSMTISGHKLHLTFVADDKLTISDRIYYGRDDKNQQMLGGHTLVATSPAAKAYQFMTVLSVDNAVNVTETYDTSDALAAMINYAGNRSDFVFFNRATGMVTAGKMTTNAQQASVLGLNGNTVTEGFAATRATMLSYGGKTLFKSENILNIVADDSGWHVETTAMQKVSLYIGEGNYDVFVNGKKVNAEIKNSMATFSIGTGASDIVLAEAVVEDTVPSEPTEPAVTTEPTEPSESTEPTETYPTEAATTPTDTMTEPTTSTVPTDSTEPSDETEATMEHGCVIPSDSEDPSEKENQNLGGIWITAAVIVLVVLTGIGVFFLIMKRKNTETK